MGSATATHKKQVTRREIQAYHKHSGFKKILVVADSLPKVIGAIGPEVFQDYFLMIDEADAFQLDSTYRDAMAICLDYFKKFPSHNRGLVTATMLEFSDPAISSLTRILIRYEQPTTYNFNLIHVKSSLIPNRYQAGNSPALKGSHVRSPGCKPGKMVEVQDKNPERVPCGSGLKPAAWATFDPIRGRCLSLSFLSRRLSPAATYVAAFQAAACKEHRSPLLIAVWYKRYSL